MGVDLYDIWTNAVSIQPNRRFPSRALARLAFLSLALLTLAGCPLAPIPDTAALAAREPVSISSDQTVEASLGSGAPSLSDSTWAVYRTSDEVLLFRIQFGPNGEVERLFDSFVFAQPWLGNEIVADGQPHATAFPGGSYISGAYASEEDDRIGVLGVLHGLLAGLHLGTARLSLYGLFDGDRFTGTMIREVVVLAETPFSAPGDAEFAAHAIRE